MIRVITVEREYGSAGVEIAHRLAERLGWELGDQSLGQRVAEKCNLGTALVGRHDERGEAWYHRLKKAFWKGPPEGTVAPPPVQSFDCAEMVAHIRKGIEEAADRGNCVIVGRGAACILSSRIDAFHFFVY